MVAGVGYGGLQQPSGGYADTGGASASASYNGCQRSRLPYQGLAPTRAAPSSAGNGVNLQPSYYFGGNVDLGWEVMKKYPNIKSVRIEIEAGQEANAQRWIKEAVTNK